MQRGLAILTLVGIVAASAAGADEMKKTAMGGEGMKKPTTVTLTGTLVDTKCYAMNAENMTDKHGDMPGCGAACANMGIPVGVVKDGKKGDPAVILLAASKSFASVMGKTVRVTGTYTWNGAALLPDKVEVQDDKGNWSEVKAKSMM